MSETGFEILVEQSKDQSSEPNRMARPSIYLIQDFLPS